MDLPPSFTLQSIFLASVWFISHTDTACLWAQHRILLSSSVISSSENPSRQQKNSSDMSILETVKVREQSLLTYTIMLDLQIFLCRGRLILGPDAASLLITTIFIVGLIIIFCYQMKSKFYHSQECTTWQHHMHRAAVLIVLLTTIMASIQNGATTCHCVSFTSIFVISMVFLSNHHGLDSTMIST
jgi:hypothetical protein